MSLFRKKVQDYAQEAVDTVKDITTTAAAEKMDIWGDLARIGTFLFIAVGAIRGVSGGHGERKVGGQEIPDVRTFTVNNYYYGPKDNHQRRAK